MFRNLIEKLKRKLRLQKLLIINIQGEPFALMLTGWETIFRPRKKEICLRLAKKYPKELEYKK